MGGNVKKMPYTAAHWWNLYSFFCVALLQIMDFIEDFLFKKQTPDLVFWSSS